MVSLLRRLTWKHRLALLLIVLPFPGVILWACDYWVSASTADVCHSEIEKVPAAPVALVLGCSPVSYGRKNLFFHTRIESAAALFKAGKVKALIVSGDNSTQEYDEPTAMKEALVKEGVPENRIYCDYAGFRTLDSVVRARSIFGQERYIVISQRFHNERAIFLARRHGLEVSGYNARDVSRARAPTTWIREYFARLKAVLDVTVLGTKPKFAGPAVEIVM